MPIQIALLVFKALMGMTPMYLQELLTAKTPRRYSLRSDVPVSGTPSFSLFEIMRLSKVLKETEN